MDGLELALRVCESTAFTLHSILFITNPLHGVASFFLNVEDALPAGFLPLAGVLLAITAALNFSSSGNVILCTQVYVAMFHFGGMFFHIRRKHHVAAPVAPALFVFFAISIVLLRGVQLWKTVLGTLGTAAGAAILTIILVKPKKERQREVKL